VKFWCLIALAAINDTAVLWDRLTVVGMNQSGWKYNTEEDWTLNRKNITVLMKFFYLMDYYNKKCPSGQLSVIGYFSYDDESLSSIIIILKKL